MSRGRDIALDGTHGRKVAAESVNDGLGLEYRVGGSMRTVLVISEVPLSVPSMPAGQCLIVVSGTPLSSTFSICMCSTTKAPEPFTGEVSLHANASRQSSNRYPSGSGTQERPKLPLCEVLY